MTQEERVNMPDAKEKQAVDIGVSIGATAKTLQAYLENQKRIRDNRPDPAAPYHLYILLGERKLNANLVSDNPPKSDPSFPFDDKDKDYLGYLAEKYQIQQDALTEAQAMRDRFETVFDTTIEKAEDAGQVTALAITDSGKFLTAVATDIKTRFKDQSPMLVLTNVQPFNRTYRSMMQAALEEQGVANVKVLSDGGKGAGNAQPQTILRECAKMINFRYQRMAKECGIENPVNPEILSGNVMKQIEASRGK